MALHGLSAGMADYLRERMLSRFGYLHYNDQYHGRHAGEYDLLRELLADEVLDDDGSSERAKEETLTHTRDNGTETRRNVLF